MHTAQTTATRQDILELIRQHGVASLSYSALQEGMLWYVKPGVGFIQYEQLATVRHNAVCLGDPICAPDKMEELLQEFVAHFPDPIMIHISKETANILAKPEFGFFINEMGVETIIDVQTFTLTGSKKEYLRSQRNRATKDGVVIAEVSDSTVTAQQLKHISEEWMHKKANHDHELAFLVRPAVFENEPDVRKFVAMINRDIIGFVFFDPMYRDGKIYGYMANILRTLGERSYSVTDDIIIEAMAVFKNEGIEQLSLGFSPFFDVADTGEFNFSKPLHDLFKYAYEHANHLYSFKSLAFHKERYRPDQPGARHVKVYCASKHALPLFALYGVFRKMGIRPITQTAEHAIHCAEEMLKHLPADIQKAVHHWRHPGQIT